MQNSIANSTNKWAFVKYLTSREKIENVIFVLTFMVLLNLELVDFKVLLCIALGFSYLLQQRNNSNKRLDQLEQKLALQQEEIQRCINQNQL